VWKRSLVALCLVANLVPLFFAARQFVWDRHAPGYDWFLTRHEPAELFMFRETVELHATSGPWRLWKKR
jgi:hypothetical protein